jgi:hypothetical protein
MMTIGHYQIGVRRTAPHPPHPPGPRRPERLAGALAVASALALVALAAQAGPAGADDSATGTVTLAVRSVSVTGGPVAYDQCYLNDDAETAVTGLVLPNGFCVSSTLVTVVNGPSPDWVELSSTPFEPTTPATGPAWALCYEQDSAPAPAGLPDCAGPLGTGGGFSRPAADQVSLAYAGTHNGGQISSQPTCDTNVTTGSCTAGLTAAAGAQAQARLSVDGPETITSPSSAFANTITWVAVPPS